MAGRVVLSVDGNEQELNGTEISLSIIPAAGEPFGIDLNVKEGTVQVATLSPSNLRRQVVKGETISYDDFLGLHGIGEDDEGEEEEDEDELDEDEDDELDEIDEDEEDEEDDEDSEEDEEDEEDDED